MPFPPNFPTPQILETSEILVHSTSKHSAILPLVMHQKNWKLKPTLKLTHEDFKEVIILLHIKYQLDLPLSRGKERRFIVLLIIKTFTKIPLLLKLRIKTTFYQPKWDFLWIREWYGKIITTFRNLVQKYYRLFYISNIIINLIAITSYRNG